MRTIQATIDRYLRNEAADVRALAEVRTLHTTMKIAHPLAHSAPNYDRVGILHDIVNQLHQLLVSRRWLVPETL